MKVFRPLIVAAAASTLLLSACGSSNNSSSGGGSASGGNSPIKLLVISQLQAPAFSFPEIADGAKAAAASINASGGVNGHKIQVDSCNDQGDPNVAATCGRQAVQGGYTAVLNQTTLYSASFMPLLEAGKVPALGTPLTAPDFTSKVSFPFAGGNPLDYGGVGFVAAKNGCKTAGIIRDTAAATDETTRFIQKGFVAGGGSPITNVAKLVGTSPDFSAPVSQITSSGVDCLLIAEPPQAVAKIVGAVRQSSKPQMPVGTLAAAFPAPLVKSLGAAANGVVVNSSVAVPSQSVTPTFLADMAKYAPSAAASGQALGAWIGVNIVKQVAGQAKAYDHSSLLTALGKASDVKVEGLAGPLDFTKPNSNPSVARVFAKYNYAYTVQDGDFNPLFDGKPVDVSAALG